jgi:hypothetical protein
MQPDEDFEPDGEFDVFFGNGGLVIFDFIKTFSGYNRNLNCSLISP